MTTPHWSNRMTLGFPMGQTTTLPIEITADETRASMVFVASRIKGLIEALGPRDVDDHDPLADEADRDVLWLLHHLHDTIRVLTAEEDRVITVLREKGVSFARIGSEMEMTAPGVKKRVERIQAAEAEGMNSAAYRDRLDSTED